MSPVRQKGSKEKRTLNHTTSITQNEKRRDDGKGGEGSLYFNSDGGVKHVFLAREKRLQTQGTKAIRREKREHRRARGGVRFENTTAEGFLKTETARRDLRKGCRRAP